jgi:prepilin-type N-terminal cleavage/methylation domain-containing protein
MTVKSRNAISERGIYPASNLPSRGQLPQASAFTLIELLVVIAIIGILASMTVVVIAKVREQGRITEGKREIHAIFNAIEEYHANTGTYPVSAQTLAAVTATKGDFTFGGTSLDAVFGRPGPWSSNNSEVMAILMDRAIYPSGAPTANFGHVKNTRQKNYLVGVFGADSTNLPGLGPDLVFRDPWGNPYIITFDLNFDEDCRDVFYELSKVSHDPSGAGFDSGLTSSDSTGSTDDFHYLGGVMIWSLGPDKKADSAQPANVAPNRDNILSWR